MHRAAALQATQLIIRDVNKAGSFKAKAKAFKSLKAKARKFGLEAKAKARDQG